MTPAAKITYFSALLLGLTLGAVYGYRSTTEAVSSVLNDRPFMASSTTEHFSFVQYRHADFEHAQAALLSFAGFLEQMDRFYPENGHHVHQLANTYARLALLADAAGKPEQAHAYLEKARSWYKSRDASDHSDSEMKAAMKKMDALLEEHLYW